VCAYVFTYMYLHVQPIPLAVTFSKAQSSKLERLFYHVSLKRDVRALSFERAFEIVTPSGIGCICVYVLPRLKAACVTDPVCGGKGPTLARYSAVIYIHIYMNTHEYLSLHIYLYACVRA